MINNYIAPQPVGLSTLNRNASSMVERVTINKFIIWYDIHIQRITKLYSTGERCNQQRWLSLTSNVTPTLFFFLHAPSIPDQIRLLVSGERTVSGRYEFVNKGENYKIRTNRNVVTVVRCVVKGWALQAGISCILLILNRFVSLDSNSYSLSYRYNF